VRTKLFSSDRNRPDALGGGEDSSRAEQERVDAITDGIQTPDDIAEAMLEGVRAGRLWVFPNRARLDAIRQRIEGVVE